MKKISISSCLLGCNCRYDASHNLNQMLLERLDEYELIPFCPEDYAFGSPRPTMDLIKEEKDISAVSNATQKNLSQAIFNYAKAFFDQNPAIELFIGKDRSPSCGVKSAKVYDKEKNLLHTEGTGLMAQVAKERGIECWDAEEYLKL